MRSSAPLLIGAILSILGGSCASESRIELDPLIDQEIVRLEKAIDGVDRDTLSESLASRLDSHREELAALRKIESTELRLFELRDPFVAIETIDFLSSHRPKVKSIGDLERFWREEKPSFERLPPPAGGSLLGALTDESSTAAERLFRASLPYGRISSPSGGLYYLAEAEANLRWVELLTALPRQRAEERVPDRGALIEAADRIESEARRAFDEEPVSRSMIPVSVRLDDAREMIESGRLAGATLQLLEAQLALSTRTARSERAGNGPISTGHHNDGTIRALLVDMGSTQDGSQAGDIARRDLIPLYDSLFDERMSSGDDQAGDVTLTLVRWPYT